MGTNYYIHTPTHVQAIHVGKHSAVRRGEIPWTFHTDTHWLTPKRLLERYRIWTKRDSHRTWMVDEYGKEVDGEVILNRMINEGWQGYYGEFC